MKKNSLLALCLFIIIASLSALSWTSAEVNTIPASTSEVVTDANTESNSLQLFDDYINEIYIAAELSAAKLDPAVFRKALLGYYNLKSSNLLATNKNIVSIVDFSKSSTSKRLWIIDLLNKKLLFNTYVAHGQGSGDDFPSKFSNLSNSHQSSLGFYLTGEIYTGKHGISLKLDGMDEGFNTNARNRAVVVHGADYVSEGFINQRGRLGRSHGCPALPVAFTKPIINTIKGKTVLFINGPENTAYISLYQNQEIAAEYFSKKALPIVEASL